MATVAATIKSCIDDNWSDVTGGTAPTVYNSETTPALPTVNDFVWVLHHTLDEDNPRFNQDFVIPVQRIDLLVSSKQDAGNEQRLDTLLTELKRIINPTNITGYKDVGVRRSRRHLSSESAFVYRATITVELKGSLESDAVTPGSTTTSTLTVDELTVNTSITATGTVTIDGKDLEQALMLGSANAAWVPCIFEVTNSASQLITQQSRNLSNNSTASGIDMLFRLPLPTVKGNLKLYISGMRIDVADADANNYVDTQYIYGMTYTGSTALEGISTNRTSPDQYDYTFTAQDLSAYDCAVMTVNRALDTAYACDIAAVLCRCYYA